MSELCSPSRERAWRHQVGALDDGLREVADAELRDAAVDEHLALASPNTLTGTGAEQRGRAVGHGGPAGAPGPLVDLAA